MTCKLWQDKFGHHLYQRLNDRIGEGPICHLHNYLRGDNLTGMDTSKLTIDTMNEYTHHWCTKRLRRYRQFESVPSPLKNPLRGFIIYLRLFNIAGHTYDYWNTLIPQCRPCNQRCWDYAEYGVGNLLGYLQIWKLGTRCETWNGVLKTRTTIMHKCY